MVGLIHPPYNLKRVRTEAHFLQILNRVCGILSDIMQQGCDLLVFISIQQRGHNTGNLYGVLPVFFALPISLACVSLLNEANSVFKVGSIHTGIYRITFLTKFQYSCNI